VKSVWTTASGETVTVGDQVALRLLEHPDAIGRIMAETPDGRIECVLVQCGSCPAGGRVSVEEDQLLLHLSGEAVQASTDHQEGDHVYRRRLRP
jgi:hypothetical protein